MAPSASSARPRLNPFLFPSDTDLRFALLVLAVLGSSLFGFDLAYQAARGPEVFAVLERCVDLTVTTAPATDLPAGAVWDVLAPGLGRAAVYEPCVEPLEQDQARWRMGGLSILVAVAGLIYLLMPALKARREKLVPLTADDAPEACAEVEALGREAGLSRPPVLLWAPLNPRATGSAFGRLGRHALALTGGLVTQLYTDPAAFRAVVRHELAHLRNADVDKTYFAIAVWYAFVAVVALPLILFIAYDVVFEGQSIGFLIEIGARAGVLALVVLVTRNAVLRARELYADVRASTHDGHPGALGRVIHQQPAEPEARWRRLFRTHPVPAARLAALQDTGHLFQFSLADAVLTGIVGTIAFQAFLNFFTAWLPVDREAVAGLPAAAILGTLVTGVLGTAIWRARFAARFLALPARSAWRLGLGVGIGMVAGRVLGIYDVIDASPDAAILSGAWGVLASWLAAASMAGLLIMGMGFFAHWIADGAGAWLEHAGDATTVRRAAWMGLGLAAVTVSAWLGVLQSFMDLGVYGPVILVMIMGALPIVGTVFSFAARDLVEGGQLATLLIGASLWVFPLIGVLWGRRARPGPTDDPEAHGWAYLESGGAAPLRDDAVSLWPPAKAALAGVAVYAACWVTWRLVRWIFIPAEPGLSIEAKTVIFYADLAVLLAMLAVVAIWVAARTRRLALPLALFAVFLAAAGGAVAKLLLGSWITVDASFVWTIFTGAVNGGLLIVPLAWAAVLISDRWRRRGAEA